MTIATASPELLVDLGRYAATVDVHLKRLAVDPAHAGSRLQLTGLALGVAGLAAMCATATGPTTAPPAGDGCVAQQAADERPLRGVPGPAAAASVRPRGLRATLVSLLESILVWEIRLPVSLRAIALDWPMWASFRDLSVCELAVAVAVLKESEPVPHSREWGRLLRRIDEADGSRRDKRERFTKPLCAIMQRLSQSPSLRQVLLQMQDGQRREIAQERRRDIVGRQEGAADSRPQMRGVAEELRIFAERQILWLEDQIGPEEAPELAEHFLVMRQLRDSVAERLRRLDDNANTARQSRRREGRAQVACMQARRAVAHLARHGRDVADHPTMRGLCAAMAANLAPRRSGGAPAAGEGVEREASRGELGPLTRTFIYHQRAVMEGRLVLPPAVILPHKLCEEGEALMHRLRGLEETGEPQWRAARRTLGAELAEVRRIDVQARADDLLWAQVRHVYQAQPQLAQTRAEWQGLALKLTRAARQQACWREGRNSIAGGEAVAESLYEPRGESADPPEWADDAAGERSVGDGWAREVTEADTAVSPAGERRSGGRGAAQPAGSQAHPAGGLAAPSPALRALVDATFDPGTFASAWRSACYHYLKHAAHLEGASLGAYIERALQVVDSDPGFIVCRRISRSHELLRLVDTPQTYLVYASDGRIVTYRDRCGRPFSPAPGGR